MLYSASDSLDYLGGLKMGSQFNGRIFIFLICITIFSFGKSSLGNVPVHTNSKEFERMKSLIGTWRGTEINGETKSPGDKDKILEAKVEYRLTAGGTAILEVLDPGKPYEMVTVYHDKNGKLEMTHYCMAGNQPRMTLKNIDEKSMEFLVAKGSDLDGSNEMHMHALKIETSDLQHLSMIWTLFEGGKEKTTAKFELTRSQPN
jgi:hypothetical protein